MIGGVWEPFVAQGDQLVDVDRAHAGVLFHLCSRDGPWVLLKLLCFGCSVVRKGRLKNVTQEKSRSDFVWTVFFPPLYCAL